MADEKEEKQIEDNKQQVEEKKEEATEAREEKTVEEKAKQKGEEKPAESKEEKLEVTSKKEVKEEKPTESKEEKSSVKLGKEAQKVVEILKDLSVMELSQLVKELESVFGVSAASAVAVGAPGAGAGAAETGAEEKSSFDVVLNAAGDKKIQVIKEVRTITGLGLKEAKAVVDAAPKAVKEGVNKEEADKIKAQLEGAGAQVEIK